METRLTAEERTARAQKAALTRWARSYDWDKCTMPEGLDHLAQLRAEAEKGGLVLQRRASNNQVRFAECYNPDCYMKDGVRVSKDTEGAVRTIIDIGSGRAAGHRTRHNPATGLMETAWACSAACFLYLGANFTHASVAPRDVSAPDNPEPQVVLNNRVGYVAP